MIIKTIVHRFDIGDTAFCNLYAEMVEIERVSFVFEKGFSKISYCVQPVMKPSYWIDESELTKINPNPTQQSVATPPPPPQPIPSSSGVYAVPTTSNYKYSQGTVTFTGTFSGSPMVALPPGLSVDIFKLSDPDLGKVKCECGAEAIGSSSHSSWCDKVHKLTDLGV